MFAQWNFDIIMKHKNKRKGGEYMSLQVWLPLTKDLRNQGLATITQLSGTAVFKDSGKIGNKSLNLHNYLTFNCPTLSGKKNFSFCF